MGKKKKKRRKREKEKTNKSQSLAPWLRMVTDPLGGLSGDERRKAILQIASSSESKFQESLLSLRENLAAHNPLLLLSTVANYGLTVGVSSKTGVDKLDHEFEIFQSHVELLQGLTLQMDPSDLSPDIFGPDVVQTVWDCLRGLTDALHFRDLKPAGADLGNDEKPVALVQHHMRMATRMVRNWGYHSQVKRIARELYSEFDADLSASRGFGVTDVLDVFETLIRIVEERRSDRFTMISSLFRAAGEDKRQFIEKYHEAIGLKETDAAEFIERVDIDRMSLDSVRSMLLSHQDLRLPEMYTFRPSDLSERLGISSHQVAEVLAEYSLPWGALEAYETEHVFLSNPVWSKPIIDLGNGQYFCVLPGCFFSFVIPCLESILEPFGSRVSDRRANYLEAKVAEILARRFPTSKTVQNLRWTADGADYETDLITFIDSCALIVECKSGKISAPALRGAPDRLKKHIQQLLVEPNLQSLRLRKRIELLSGRPEIADPIRERLPHDLALVKRVLRVSVCLEDFGAIQSSLKQLKNTTWLPDGFQPCPTMNLADLETVFDILEHPVQVIHYLLRREAIEGTIGYLADELDLLGLYLTTLLNVGPIEDDAYLLMTGMSAPIDKYYNSLDAGIRLEKPRPKITPLFVSIFSQLEDRRPDRWTELGVALNMFSPDDQAQLSRSLAQLEKSVRRKWKSEGHKNMLILAPPQASEYSLAYVMYKNENAERRREFVEHAAAIALEPNHVKQAVVIAKNIDRKEAPYDILVLAE